MQRLGLVILGITLAIPLFIVVYGILESVYKSGKNKKGFTLIELLIVITIIGILLTAFVPLIIGTEGTTWR